MFLLLLLLEPLAIVLVLFLFLAGIIVSFELESSFLHVQFVATNLCLIQEAHGESHRLYLQEKTHNQYGHRNLLFYKLHEYTQKKLDKCMFT